MTTMIATFSAEKPNLDESISTCRFAQRVALIKNDAILNEETDPRLVIVQLRKQNAELKAELALVTGTDTSDTALTVSELDTCHEMVTVYLNNPSPEAAIILGDGRKIRACFLFVKDLVKKLQLHIAGMQVVTKVTDGACSSEELGRLKELVKQRDNEISILLAKIKQTDGQTRKGGVVLQPEASLPRGQPETSLPRGQPETSLPRGQPETSLQNEPLLESAIDKELFETFRETYPENFQISENKRLLKQLYTKAKTLGEAVNMHRETINAIKERIQHRRMELVPLQVRVS